MADLAAPTTLASVDFCLSTAFRLQVFGAQMVAMLRALVLPMLDRVVVKDRVVVRLVAVLPS
jgi:hypothetical protein